MRISFHWLSELVDLTDEVGPDAIAERLSLAGLEVEAVEDQAAPLKGVVVARVLEKAPHPQADRLSVCSVDRGASEPVQVVCGATNFKAGDLVAFAPVGTTLPGGLEIKEAAIRGVTSRGMLCSERELGVSDRHEGIIVLDPKGEGAVVGAPVAEALSRDDVVLEIGVTPNRPDALSHVGVAREVAAIFGTRTRFLSPTCAERGGPVDDVAKVEIEDLEGCPRYACRVVEGVKVGPSPAWLVARLEACGVRSINNIVDVTNYVMMERGIPLHAFDLDRIGKERERATIVVRSATAGESLTTLDGKERELDAEDLVIADPRGAIALAGVMGGADTEVRETTTRILLEAAYFQPARVRRTARHHGIHSEASHRFERGCDPNGVRASLDRAAALLAELGGGVVCRGAVDFYPKKIEPAVVSLRPKRAAELMGVTPKVVDEAAASKILLAIGLEVAGREGEAVRFRVPTFRPDLTREVDLIEELLRLIGYDKVPPTLPARTGEAKGLYDEARHRVEPLVRTALEAAGFSEAINFAFTSKEALSAFDGGDPARRITLKNPLGEEMSVMRTSLLPGLLANAALNQRRQLPNVRLYEMATVFLGRNPEGQRPRLDLAAGPRGADAWAIERPRVAGVITGEIGARGFDRRPQPADFYDVKGVVESLCDRVGLDVGVVARRAETARVTFRQAGDEQRFLHPRARALVEIERANGAPRLLGTVGELHPDVRERFDLKGPVFVFELDTAVLAEAAPSRPAPEVPPRFPAVRRDFALVLDDDVPAASLSSLLAGHPAVQGLVEDLEIFDVYTGEHVAAGKKSVALSVVLRASDRTLTDDEVARAADALVDAAKKAFSAEIRS